MNNAARANYSSGLSLRMMFAWPSIASSPLGSFDYSLVWLLTVAFFFFALCPRDTMANKIINLTILTSKYHSSLISNTHKYASRVSQKMLREYSSSPERLTYSYILKPASVTQSLMNWRLATAQRRSIGLKWLDYEALKIRTWLFLKALSLTMWVWWTCRLSRKM